MPNKPIAEMTNREIDREVAERMGYTCYARCGDDTKWRMRKPHDSAPPCINSGQNQDDFDSVFRDASPYFTTDICAAMWLLDAVRGKDGYVFTNGELSGHCCILKKPNGEYVGGSDESTRELAIARCCLAVLRERQREEARCQKID